MQIRTESDLLYDILELLEIIKKTPNERTMIDLYKIVNYLSNTKLGIYFKEEFADNKEIYEKFNNFLQCRNKT